MLASQIPTKIVLPFGASAGGGFIRTVPVASQIGITPGAASYTDGFVPLNFLPVGGGGIPPDGRDVNGILNAISAWSRWQGAGNPVPFDSAYSSAVGGYPQGAIVASVTTPLRFWYNLVDNNVSNPDSSGAGWLSFSPFNQLAGPTVRLTANLAAAGASVAVTADQIGVAVALGSTGFVVSSFSQTLNTGTTGAGGMDTGSAPVSGFVSIYAIFNPTTGAASILGTTASQATVYGGANMPAGYTMSALIAIWPTNGSSQLVAGSQVDRQFYGPNVSVLTGGSALVATAVSLVSAVPIGARTFSAIYSVIETGTVGGTSDANFGPTSVIFPLNFVGAISGGQLNSVAVLPLVTAQQCFYKVLHSTMQAGITVNGYSI